MHYRNGRPANNGDLILQLTPSGDPKIVSFGVLHDATPGNDYCNGSIAVPAQQTGACMCDCIHVDDIVSILAEKGLDQRPGGQVPPHYVRMKHELRDLNSKRDALAKFIETDSRFAALDPLEQARMQKQFEAMTDYAAVLHERLSALETFAQG